MDWPYFVGGFVWGFYIFSEHRRRNWSLTTFLGIWLVGIVSITLTLNLLGV